MAISATGRTNPDPILTNEQSFDLICLTLASLGRGKLDVAFEHNSYPFMDEVLKEDRIEVAGTGIQGRIRLDSAGNASWIVKGEEIESKEVQTTAPYAVPWRYCQANYSTEHHDILENSGDDVQLYDYGRLRRLDGIVDLVDMVEGAFWSAAPATATEKAMWGVNVFAGKYKDTVDGAGYYGGLPGAGWADIQGIVPCTDGSGTAAIAGGHRMWRNWCAGYKAINAHWVKQMDMTMRRMKMRAPLLAADLLKPPHNKFRIYCGVNAAVEASSYQRKRGSDDGPEIARNGPRLTFNGILIEETDSLDYDTDWPFFFVNRGYFAPHVLKGDYLRETAIKGDRKQPDVNTHFIFLTLNMLLRNRRYGVAVVNKY